MYVGADDFGACPREVMFDSDPEKAGRQGVASVPCFVMSDIGNRMPVLISNASAESVKIYRNSVIGQITAAAVQEAGEQYKVMREGPVEVDAAQADIEDADEKRLLSL